MIEGVKIIPLRQIPDERGKISHMLRSDADYFKGFGEIYFSTVNPGAIKAWHIHSEQTLNYAVISGMIKFVIYDDRKDSPTMGNLQEVFMGQDNYCLVQVPPFIWNGFKGISAIPAIVANCTDIPYSPDEISRTDPFDNHIPYDWSLKQG